MFNENNKELVNEMIMNEWKNACDTYGYSYKNKTEELEVLVEEINEARQEMAEVNNMFFTWLGSGLANKSQLLDEMLESVKNGMLELAQVGAVINKIKQTNES